MMIVDVAYASELGDALLDAVDMVMEDPTPVGVIRIGHYIVATRSFNPEEVIIIVFPNNFAMPESVRIPQLAA